MLAESAQPIDVDVECVMRLSKKCIHMINLRLMRLVFLQLQGKVNDFLSLSLRRRDYSDFLILYFRGRNEN
ncbi:MAG: hypothetical protein ACRCVV_09080 [Shewanella sp.]